MHLLYITPEPWPTFRADIRALFGKYLPRFGISCDLVTERPLQGSENDEAWMAGRLVTWESPRNRGAYHLRKLVKSFQALLSMNSHNYDAVQVRDMPIHAFIALVIAKAKCLPFFYWMSFPQSEGQIHRARERGVSAGLKYWFPLIQGSIGKWILFAFVLPRADHVFVQSATMRNDLIREGIPAEKLTPVPMGIDLESAVFSQLPPVDDPKLAGRRVLVYLGTLDPARRIEGLFEMLALVRRSEPKATLVLVGDTEDEKHREWLRGQVEANGVSEAVIWTGWVPPVLAWRYVRAAEVGLSPCPRGILFDCGSPTKTIEYLALGVPVVVNDNPDQARVVRESGAGFCVEYEPEKFADATLRLLRDGELRRCMAAKGRPYVEENRTYRVIAAELAARYREVLGQPS